MTASVSVLAPATGTVGIYLPITGGITPAGDAVQLQLSAQNGTLPTGAWFGTQTAGSEFSGLLLPVAEGTWYVWAYDPVTGAQAVSSPVAVGSAGGTTVPVPASVVASLLGGSAAGDTPDELTIAEAASDTDIALVAQGGKVLFSQTFSNIWTWIQGHLPGYLLPQVTVSVASTVNLDNSSHNQRVLLITAAGVTLTPLVPSLGPGFTCEVINASGSTVALVGITTDTGASTIQVGGITRVLAATSPAGILTVYAKL